MLQWKTNEYYIFWVCVCSVSYPACYAYAPHCHLWPALLYNIFPHYHISGKIFEIKLLNTQRVMIFSTTFAWKMFHSCATYYQNKYIGLHVKYLFCLPDFNETWIFSTGFRENSQISNIIKICFVEAELFHADRRTDGHDEVNSPFRNFANKSKKDNQIKSPRLFLSQ
jgi:hypothetical protein